MTYLEEIATYLFSEYEEAYDKIPKTFNFITNPYAVEFKIAENVTDRYYKDDVTLQVRVVGVENKIVDGKSNRWNILNKANTLLEELNKLEFDNYRIIKEDVPLTTYTDEDKFNVVLMLIVQKYN